MLRIARLSILVVALLFPAFVFAQGSASSLLVPRTVSGLAIDLTDFIQIPASSSERPRARINFLFPAGDGSGRLFVNDMRGKIYVIRNGALLPAPFLDMQTALAPHFIDDGGSNSELGLVTFAFHPDFSRKGSAGYGKFYTLQSEDAQSQSKQIPVFRFPQPPQMHHHTVLSEWSIDSKNPDRIDPASHREILRIAAPADDHIGGQLGFDPKLVPGDKDYGLLYISVGDGGNTSWDHGKVAAYRQAENMMSAFGKILRVNPLAVGARTYTLPATNPFIGHKGVLPEIWASGLRNPERFSWDRGGARAMLIADIGQANIEEINLGKAGANYGWSTYEGDFTVDHTNEGNLTSLAVGQLPAGIAFPVAEYSHTDGQGITGGFVYRGKRLPELAGKYIFGDIMTGDIFYADAQSLEAGQKTKILKFRLFYRGKETSMRDGVLGKSDHAGLRFGLGEDGEIYVLTKSDGMIRKLSRRGS